jgi:alpha-1,3-rhamnosyl/mannosyltransferase
VEGTIHVGIDGACWTNDRGYGRFTRSLVRALARRDSGFRYTLVVDAPPPGPTPPGVAVLAGADAGGRDGASGATRSPLALAQVALRAARARFDVFFYPAVFSYFPLPASTPCVVCFHDAIAERFPKLIFPSAANAALWNAKTALARLQATRAMTISQASARDLETILRIPTSRIDVITEGPDAAFQPLPADRAAVRARYDAPADAAVFVYVGGFNRHKNVMALLRAMPAVIAAHANAHLVIVGDLSGRGFWDNRAALQDAVRADPALAARVRFPGYLPDADLAVLFNAADAFVFPSLWEGFGLPAVEAMACGLPVLASRAGSLPEIVGEAGLFFDPEDEAAIAAAMIGFLNAPQTWPALKARSLAQAGRFTWDRAAELAEHSFRSALAGRGGHGA